MTRTNLALLDHAEQTQTDARAVESHINKLLAWGHWPANVEDIKATHINKWIADAERGYYSPLGSPPAALSPSTIQTRLSVLKKAMARSGVAWPVDVKMPQRSKRPKWVLSVEQQRHLEARLVLFADQTLGGIPARLLMDYITFVTETGLRVEEALRVEEKHLIRVGQGDTPLEAAADGMFGDKWVLEVMGTKTAGSYDLIPLSQRALDIFQRRVSQDFTGGPIFKVRYDELRLAWQWCLTELGVTDDTATLKSLRRTFATRLAAKGIPTTLLQKLMRHASLVTTSHYTNSIGLHEAAREWLN